MAPRVFLTAFGPFGLIRQNPSQWLAEQSDCPHEIIEVSYHAAEESLHRLSPSDFDVLLLLGVAAGRDRLTPEFFARNYAGKLKDVRGEAPLGLIDEKEPHLLPTSLWTAEQVADWTVREPVRASFNAGNYLCNYIYFRALQRFPAKAVGFLHVPAPEQVSLDRQLKVLKKIIANVGR